MTGKKFVYNNNYYQLYLSAVLGRPKKRFETKGDVVETGFPDGSNRYDGDKPDPQPHVMCIKCKKIVDPDLAGLDVMKKEVFS